MYIYNHVHTYQMWVNDVFLDRRMTILHFFLHTVTFFNWSWVDPLCFIGFSLFWRCVSLFFIVFFNYTVQPKVIISLWWKDMDFKKKRVPREKSGRHSNLIYLVLKPLKKSGTAFGDLSVFWRCFFIIVQCFFIVKIVFIDFSLFWRCCSLFSMIFHYFQDVFNYFSLIVQCVYMFFIIFHCIVGSVSCIFCIFVVHGRHGTVESSIFWSFGVFRTT